jgi:ATP-binding cassette subfamily B protein
MDQALSVGQLMFFFSLLSTLLDTLQRLAAVNLQFQDALVAVDRLYQILDEEVEPLDNDQCVAFSAVREAVELRDLSFRYGCRANVLDRVNLAIPAGQTQADLVVRAPGRVRPVTSPTKVLVPARGEMLTVSFGSRVLEVNFQPGD